MKKLLVTAGALIGVLSFAYAPALAEAGKVTRIAACKADCSSSGLHGSYRTRVMDDSQQKSIWANWGEVYSECVRTCLAPLPPVYIQRGILESGGDWFGKSASNCMDCHAKGPNLRVPDTISRGNAMNRNPDAQ